jgi:helix-turn-helix protein
MKPDERELLIAVQSGKYPTPLEAGEALGMNAKRISYICEKWINKGWLECGVSARTGWLTEAGKAVDPGRN